MSRWGTFVTDLDEVHVAPCDEQGELVGDHEFAMGCRCGPMRDDVEPTLVIHNDPERGGCNA